MSNELEVLNTTTMIINPSVIEFANKVAIDLADKATTMFTRANGSREFQASEKYPLPTPIRVRLDHDGDGQMKTLSATLNLPRGVIALSLPTEVHTTNITHIGVECGTLAEYKDWLDERDGVEQLTSNIVWLIFKYSLQHTADGPEF